MRISCPLISIELTDKEIALIGGYVVLIGLILLYWVSTQGLRGPLVCIYVDFQKEDPYGITPNC